MPLGHKWPDRPAHQNLPLAPATGTEDVRGAHPRRPWPWMPSTSPPWAYNYVDRNPSPHLVQPLLDPPSPHSSSARFRARKLCGHHCLALVTAATVLAVPQEHVQEVRQGRLRPFRASIRAEALRSRLHLHLLRTAATTSSSLPLLRDSPDLLTSSTRTGVSSSLGSLFFRSIWTP